MKDGGPAIRTDIRSSGKKGNPSPKELSSRGVPASESLWLDNLEQREDKWKDELSLGLTMKHILQMVFPKKYQPIYYDMSLSFMNLVLSEKTVSGTRIKEMLQHNNFSKATFHNKILPRLKSVGMIKAIKQNNGNSDSSRVAYTYDTSFSNFFEIVCNDYKRIIRLAETRHETNGGEAI